MLCLLAGQLSCCTATCHRRRKKRQSSLDSKGGQIARLRALSRTRPIHHARVAGFRSVMNHVHSQLLWAGAAQARTRIKKKPCSSTTHRKGGDYIMLDLPAHETLTKKRTQGRDGAREALTRRACYLRTLCRDVRKGIPQLLPPCFVAAKLFESTQRRDLQFLPFLTGRPCSRHSFICGDGGALARLRAFSDDPMERQLRNGALPRLEAVVSD